MAKAKVLTLTPTTILGLFFIQRYRFLTIVQFARAAGLSTHRAEDVLRALELHGMLGHFGHVRIPPGTPTPSGHEEPALEKPTFVEPWNEYGFRLESPNLEQDITDPAP
jgi:hypothetical protein